jgi:hypothetical protein
MPGRTTLATAALLMMYGRASQLASPEIRPGVWAAQQPEALPLPGAGYEAYLVGEMHGVQENAEFQLHYLEQLHHASGLRDIVIEERGVFENDVQAFVDGRLDVLPDSLCLRVDILQGIRRLNTRLKEDDRIRVHFTDIDSPPSAIRRHLLILQQRLGANKVRIPNEPDINKRGLETVARLKRLNLDPATRSEVRTVEFSILCLRQGLEFDVGPPKGSPYLDSREEAVTSNIVDLIRNRGIQPLLVVYGSDHVSRTPRQDGGPNRNQPFLPMALRLDQAGIKTFAVSTVPLEGRTFWRGRASEILGTAVDGHLTSGETLDKVLASASEMRLFYIDAKRERVRLPSEDISKTGVDAFLLFRSGGPIINRCGNR